MKNVFFDTCVYHQPGIDLLFEVIDVDNILFGSEMVGAVRGIDPETGHYFDDTKRYVDALGLAADDRQQGLRGQRPPGLPAPGRPAEGEGAVMMPAFTTDADWLPFHPSPTQADVPCRRPARSTRTATCSARATSSRTRPSASTPRRRRQGPAVRPARLPRLRAQRDRAGDLPRRRQLARMVDALRAPGGRARGVATDTPDGHRRRARASCTRPVCAACASTSSSAWSTRSRTPTTARSSTRIAPLGWHVVVYFEAADLAERWDLFTSLPTTVVVDHMGRPDVTKPVDGAGVRAVPAVHGRARERLVARSAARSGCRSSGPPEYADVVPFARTVVERVPRPGALGHRLAAPEHEEPHARRRPPGRRHPADRHHRGPAAPAAGRQPDPPLLGGR